MKELPKAYVADEIEQKWYRIWEERNFFQADPSSSKPPYCVIMPPPNVTGVLHMGHALVSTLQDVMVRWKRMSGYETLWVPGMDHAGIATQTVVERHLIKTQGKRRADYPRKEFVDLVWEWKEKSAPIIRKQLQRLGCSCDWSRECFTLDEPRSRAVQRMFKALFDKGLIYRGDYLVNWDPVTETAIADDEVEYEDRSSFLWHFKYPLADGSGHVHIATTRPETMLGDTAIAVSPKDSRFQHLIGQTAVLPIMNRPLPIIADEHVDPAFGTGMVKITPAHDPNDYQIGINHNLPMINIMTSDGRINENGGPFVGMRMDEAREGVIKKMGELGLLEKIEPHTNRVGVSYRSRAVIEPHLSKQWFINMRPFAAKLRQAVKEEKTRLIPKNWENTYFHWINNLRDWCISRQLWWGHRIPVWYNKEDPENILCYEGDDLPPEVKADPDAWHQEDDVLDTWFSSALWPFSVLGWPDNSPELQRFYPNDVLITGHDILFFWVARMLMMGEEAMGEVPFPEAYLHGLIYGKSYWRQNPTGGITYVPDEERIAYDKGEKVPADVHFRWEKMSKTKGNIIDPLEICDEYGTDAMRMALCASPSQAREIDLDRRRFEEFRNFANKVWNGARFVFMNLEGLTSEAFSEGFSFDHLRLEDRWILSKLNSTIDDVNKHLGKYAFDQAAMEAYDFFWKEFCAYYVEISKPILFEKEGTPKDKQTKQQLLVIILCQALRLLHPMAPYITEELFSLLQERFPGLTASANIDPYTKEAIEALKAPACIVAPFPQVIRKEDIAPTIEETFALIEEIVLSIRQIRGEMKIPPSKETDLVLYEAAGGPLFPTVKKHEGLLRALLRLGTVTFANEPPFLAAASTAIIRSITLHIPLPSDLLAQEKKRLEKEQVRLSQSLERVQKQLANPDFVSRAPPPLIEKQKLSASQLSQELTEISDKLASLP